MPYTTIKSVLFVISFFFTISVFSQRFSPSSVVAVNGIYPTTAQRGDFDNDGDDDILVCGQSWNTPALILFETQNGQVVERANTGLPASASGAYWVDYDGDLDLDVFVFNTFSTFVQKLTTASFYINNNGTFTTPVSVTLPPLRAATFSLIDYDKDNDTDILVSGFEGSGLPSALKTYLLNNTGNNIFTKLTTSFPNTGSEQFVRHAWGDFDNDSDPDVLVSTTAGSVLFSNNGGGNFSALIPSPQFPGLLEGNTQFADFDKDNDLDLLISGRTSSSQFVKIFVNNGNKTFSEYTDAGLPTASSSYTEWIDYDGDGDLDLYHSGYSGSSFFRKIFERDGSTYTEVNNAGLPQAGFAFWVFFDYDKDTDFDLLALYDGLKTRIYRNNLKSNPVSLDTRPAWLVDLYARPASTSSIELTWFDVASDEDFISIEQRDGSNGTFHEVSTVSGNLVSSFTPTAVTGLTPGVDYAFRVRAHNSSGYSRYSNTVVARVASPDLLKSNLPPISTILSSSWADIDNDGDMDLMYSGYGSDAQNYAGQSVIMKNAAGHLELQANALPALSGYDMDWADYDHDGDMDLLLSGTPSPGTPASGTAQTKLMVNQGNFTFTEYTQSSMRGIRSGFSRWVDVNNDGYMDIFLSGTVDGNNTIHTSQLLINKRNNTFEEQTNSGLPALYQSTLEAADFNNDGLVDFVMGGFRDSLYYSSTTTLLYFNQGDNSFRLQQKFEESSDASIKSADVDQDGDLDIIVAGNSGKTMVYLNDNGTFTLDARNNLPGFLYGKLVTADLDNDGDPDILFGGIAYKEGRIRMSRIFLNDGTGVFQEGFYPLSHMAEVYAPGHLDADGDLDIFEGLDAGTHPNASLFENKVAAINQRPTAPTLTKAEPIAGGIKLIWKRGADDHTPSKSLTSNIFVKDASGKYLFNSHADVTTGKLKKVAYGNTYLNDSIVIQNLLPGEYTVGVQNIDNSFMASLFATANVTVSLVAPGLISGAGVCEDSQAEIRVLGNSIVWYKSANLTDSIGNGNVFRPGIKKTDSVFYAVQKTGAVKSSALKVTVAVFKKITGTVTQQGDSLVAPAGTSYQWYKNGMPIEGQTKRRLFATVPGEYGLTVFNGPCSSSTLSYLFRPVPPQGLATHAERCVGQLQTITATGNNIQWYDKAGTVIGFGNSFTIASVTLENTSIFLTQIVNSVSSIKGEITWNTFDYPEKAIALDGGTLIASEGISYQWYLNNSSINGATNRELANPTDGSYHVEVSNHACKTISEIFLYTGIEESRNQLCIFQSHAEGSVIVQAGDQRITGIDVYDYTGRQIMSVSDLIEPGESYILDVSKLKKGPYIARSRSFIPAHGKFIKY